NLSQNSSLTLEQQRVQQSELQHQNMVKLGANVHFVFLLRQFQAQGTGQHEKQTNVVPPPTQAPWPPQPPQQSPSAPPSLPSQRSQTAERPAFLKQQTGAGETVIARPPTANVPALIISSNTSSERQVYDLIKPVTNV